MRRKKQRVRHITRRFQDGFLYTVFGRFIFFYSDLASSEKWPEHKLTSLNDSFCLNKSKNVLNATQKAVNPKLHRDNQISGENKKTRQ